MSPPSQYQRKLVASRCFSTIGKSYSQTHDLTLRPGTTTNNPHTDYANPSEILKSKLRATPRDRGRGTQADRNRCHRAHTITLLHKPNIHPEKVSGQWRLILNLKRNNSHLTPPHFKMEGLRCIQYTLTPQAYMAKVDLKDVYLTVSVHPTHRKYLQFTVRYDADALRAQHRTFCIHEIMKALIAILRSFGIRLVVYLGDIMKSAASPQRLSQDTTLTISLLT